MYCNPDICPHCQYIGEGDSYCEQIDEIVLSDWEPTEYSMSHDCPYTAKKNIKTKGRRRKRHGFQN